LDVETFSVSEFKARCLALIERVRRTGETVLITKKGKPVAQVLPAPPPEPGAGTAFGCMAGTASECADIVEPLGAEDWEALR
jgi:prevent-host-death family protein